MSKRRPPVRSQVSYFLRKVEKRNRDNEKVQEGARLTMGRAKGGKEVACGGRGRTPGELVRKS